MAEEDKDLKAPESVSEITDENAHLIDFENLKVRLLCLISIPNAFAQVASYLTRRGWEVSVTTEIKEALTQAGTFNPDFVLMSVNHPHKKINQVPQIISHTFNVPVLAFGEKTDSKSIGAIQTSRAQYKIMGRLSGPTAQRKIKAILQDKYQVQEESKEGGRAFENMGGGIEKTTIKFRGPKQRSSGTMIFEKNQSQMYRADGYNPFRGGKTQDKGHESKGVAYDPTQSEEYEQNVKAKLSLAEQKQKDQQDLAAALKELGSEIGSGNLDRGEESDEAGALMQKGVELKSAGSSQQDPTEDAEGFSKTQDGYTMESEYQPKEKKGAPVMESKYIGKSSKEKSLLNQGDQRTFVEKATISVVNQMKAEDHHETKGLGLVNRVALLSLGHRRHKGYFMIAGHDIGMSLDDFVEEFTQYFMKLSTDQSEAVEFGDYINMDCPGYDFFDNGEEGLEFNFVTPFAAGEVGVKFIHDEEAWAHAEPHGEYEKTIIKAEQIIEDKPLEIDLFVHLKRNQKYYKIVGKDSELSADRKKRLVEKETRVFINNEDVRPYRKYQTKHKAQKAINETKQRTTKKKAS